MEISDIDPNPETDLNPEKGPSPEIRKIDTLHTEIGLAQETSKEKKDTEMVPSPQST